MQNEDLIPKIINGLRQKKVSSFEDIFLLTYKTSLSDIKQYVSDDELAWSILEEIYIKVWNRAASVPEKNLLRTWIRILIKESLKNIENIKEVEIREFEDDMSIEENNKLEERALTVLIKIEEELDILEYDEKESTSIKIIKKILRISFSVFIAFMAGFILFNVYSLLKDTFDKEKISNKIEKISSIEEQSDIKEKELKLGWIEVENSKKYRKSNGKLAINEFLSIDNKIYYFDNNNMLQTGKLKKGIYTYEFNQNGVLIKIDTVKDLYSEENSFIKNLSERGYKERAGKIIANSEIEDNIWIYYLENLEERGENINLLRYNKEDEYLERIDTDVSGFILIDDTKLCYCKENEIKIIDVNISATKIAKSYNLSIVDYGYILTNTFGEIVKEESLDIEDRTYYFKGNKIDSVSTRPTIINGNTYSFKYGDNKIYINGNPYIEDGLAITAMTHIDNYIYYSTIVNNSSYIYRSRINRIDVNTQKIENISPEFNGSILTMYYYKNYSGIYMEYLSEAPANSYGSIAILSKENDFLLIKDDKFRNIDNKNQILELVMVDDSGIHCYLDDVKLKENGNIQIISKKPLTINESVVSRIE